MADRKQPPALDVEALAPYLRGGWTLIPLHRPTDRSTHHGKERADGKRPLDKDWTARAYRSEAVAKAAAEQKRNVGVRLTAGQLVVDVDPRNGGDAGFAALCRDLGLDAGPWPHVITGSGGSHYYLTKPADVPVLDSLEQYPGVEFKSKGRQVVSAGSVHPDTLRPYEWDFLQPPLAEAPECPRVLLDMIRRPQGTGPIGGGQHTQAEAAQMLDALDPVDFRDHDRWLQLMMAVHHATNGDARAEFLEWSSRDPQYEGQEGVNGRRWDSLHADAASARITYRTLHKFVTDAGHPEAIPRRADAADDFEGLPGAEEMGDDFVVPLSPLEELNREYICVTEDSQFRVMTLREDPDMGRERWLRMKTDDFAKSMANRFHERPNRRDPTQPVVQPLSKAWLEWHARREAVGVVFDPQREVPGYLNLWTGWAVKPVKGDWSLMRRMIREVLADGDEVVDTYVMDWLAALFQRPWQAGQVALYFKGDKGVGKSTLGRAVCRIAGRHGMHISSAGHLTGRFNDHLRDLVFLFADEAVRPYDKEAEGRLKALITEPTLVFEGKGRDVKAGPNRIHVMGASNEEWVAPATADERRFAIAHVNSSWRGRTDLWKALNEQMERGGYEAMLFDLTRRELPEGWEAQAAIPPTKELMSQKVHSLGPLAGFWHACLEEGELPFAHEGDWEAGTVKAFYNDLREAFDDWCRKRGVNPGGMGRNVHRFMWGEMRKLCPDAREGLIDRPDDRPDLGGRSDGRAKAVRLPSLADSRRAFEGLMGGDVGWPEDVDLDADEPSPF